MPNTILIKKSGTASAVPSSLSYGELAINYADGRLYYKNAAGSIVPLTANSGLNAKLDALTFNGSTTTFNLASSSTAVTPANANSLLISLNGVIQEPGVAYTVSGSQITFTVAPVSTDTFFGVHLTGGAVGGGAGAGGDAVTATPSQITANQNNYALPSNTDIVRLSSNAVRTITGFEADAGAVVTLYNVGGFDIRIDHEDTASTAANRVTSATGADIVLSPNDNITLVYDSTSSRWRTSGVVKTVTTGQAAVYEFLRNSAPADATGSLGAWTWTLPAGAKFLEILVLGGGGGGASGMRGAAGTTRSGGGGGGCSSISIFDVSVASLSTTTASVTVGAGGAGGASVTTDNSNGNASSSGGVSSVDFGIYRFSTGVGRGAAAPTSSTAAGALGSQASSLPGQVFGEAGRDGGVGAAGTAAVTAPNNANQLRSGAGGGGINSSNTAFAGGTGSLPGQSNSGGSSFGGWLTLPTLPAAGAAGGGNGTSATFAALPMTAGGAGAGGGGHASGAGGSGGNGAIGGGGGGGGASVNGFASGAGGNGGDGYVRITVWF
jgi:hypothetical protein